MTKINLKNLSLNEVLSKDELKKIVGGNGSGGGAIYPHTYRCTCYNGGFDLEIIYYVYSDAEIQNIHQQLEVDCESNFSCV